MVFVTKAPKWDENYTRKIVAASDVYKRQVNDTVNDHAYMHIHAVNDAVSDAVNDAVNIAVNDAVNPTRPYYI